MKVLPLLVERLMGARTPHVKLVADLAAKAGRDAERSPIAAEAAREALAGIAERIASGQLTPGDVDQVRQRLRPLIGSLLPKGEGSPIYFDAMLAAAAWKDEAGLAAARRYFAEPDGDPDRRLLALRVVAASGDDSVLDTVEALLIEPKKTPTEFRGKLLATLGGLDSPQVAEVILRNFATMEPGLKPRAIEVLTQRPSWSEALIRAIRAGAISKDAVNLTQVRKLLASKDAGLAKAAREVWGTVREGRNPAREQVIARYRETFRVTPGDPRAGAVVFKNLCAQCHKIYGEGQEVGPELTGSGRASFEQLLSNVLDPSLVIGEAYQATSVATQDGRVLVGLRVEDTPQRIVIKIQGGKLEVVARAHVEEVKVGPLSLMPEDIEKQLKPQEIVDLFAFLALDKPPTDPTARPLPGTPPKLVKPRGR